MASIVDILDERSIEQAAIGEKPATLARNFSRLHPVIGQKFDPGRATDGVTVIIPCYNEQEAIISTIRRVHESLEKTKRSFEVIVVNDGSTDATTTKLRMYKNVQGLQILSNESNRGYGFSIKRAVSQARYETIVITDADGTYPIERIEDLVRKMESADMVVGARITAGARIPLVRRPAKWLLRKIASYLAETEIPDLNSGLRVMKRSLIRSFLPLLPDGFSFTTTITLALLTHGYQVRYVPIDYAKRVGRSSIRPIRDTLNFFSLIVRTTLYFRPLKVFVPASAALVVCAAITALASKFFFGQVADVTSVTLGTAGLQLLAVGLLADLIDKRSPSYT